jgi:hypothetical protein
VEPQPLPLGAAERIRACRCSRQLVSYAIVRSGLSLITIDLDDDRARLEAQFFPSAGSVEEC